MIFLKGLIIGFSIAAPVGPIGVLCIRRTLANGRTYGLISGLGAASADAFYGCIAGFGLTAVSSFLVDQQDWFRLIGGAFLCYLGIRTVLARPADNRRDRREKWPTPCGLYLYPGANAHQPRDDPLLCRHFYQPRRGE